MWSLNHRAMITIGSCVPNCGRERSFYLVVAWPFPYLRIASAFIAQTTSKWGDGKCFCMMWWKEQSIQNLSSFCQSSHGQFQDWEYVTSNLTFSAQLLRARPEDESLAHKRIILCQCSPAGCGCSCLHCVAVTLQMKNRQLRVAREKPPWLSLDIALPIWAAKMQTCRTFPLACIAALSQETNIAWGSVLRKDTYSCEREGIGNNPMWEARSECGNCALHRWLWHIPS